jgi:squalene-hopene/tetraprenyl-beta-curcumene cyclase
MPIMRRAPLVLGALACTWLLAITLTRAAEEAPPAWNAKAAAAYLDDELAWWATWANAARDHGTFCVSCHTATPYVLARPALAAALGEAEPSASARQLFENVARRVSLWGEVEPWYPDQTRGLPKTSESRGTESVLNALVLATRDARTDVLADDTRQAFAHMWAQQMKTGPLDGAWAWLNFTYAPWEAPESPYFGAAMAVAALGAAPGGYAKSADAQPGLTRLVEFVGSRFDEQILFNRATMIVAAKPMADLVTPAQLARTAADVAALQEADGGWSLSRFGAFARVDRTPLDTASDGSATALAVLALKSSAEASHQAAREKGLVWLRSHQEASGRWTAVSLNKSRDPKSDPARFMHHAATAYAVLALTDR